MANVKRIKRRRTKRVSIDDAYYKDNAEKAVIIKKKQSYTIECYFDGACSINPDGVMGIGAYIVHGKDTRDISYGVLAGKGNSNNVSEYMAFNEVLYYLLDNATKKDEVIIYGDSMLVVKQSNGQWRIKNGAYKEYALEAKDLLKSVRSMVKSIKIKWIARDGNDIADALSKEGVKEIMG